MKHLYMDAEQFRNSSINRVEHLIILFLFLVRRFLSFSFSFFCFSFDFSKTDSVAMSVVHLSPLGSQVSFAQHSATRIENVVDWDSIAKKYRSLFGIEPDETGSTHTEADAVSNASETQPTAAQSQQQPMAQVGNNMANAMNQV